MVGLLFLDGSLAERKRLNILVLERAGRRRLKEMGLRGQVEGTGEREGLGLMAAMARLICWVRRR